MSFLVCTPAHGGLVILPHCRVLYVDGAVVDCEFSDWSNLRSEGIDEIHVRATRGHTVLSGHSVYWIYPEANAWVAGCGSVNGNLPPEVVVYHDGRHEARRIEFMPDLPHSAVKLGWWK